MLVKNLVWRVGDRRKIKVWGDKWISGLEGFCLHYEKPSNSNVELVCDLIRDGRWDSDWLKLCFSADEVKAVEAIPVSLAGTDDKLFWSFYRDVAYTVKSVYYSARVGQAGRVSSGACFSYHCPKVLWKAVWSDVFPPKVQHFLWRACSGALATGGNPFKRRCCLNPSCPVCDSEEESVEHLLLTCDWAQKVWYVTNASIRIRKEDISYLVLGNGVKACWLEIIGLMIWLAVLWVLLVGTFGRQGVLLCSTLLISTLLMCV